MSQKGYNPERSAFGGESKGFAPILIVLLIAIIGIGGYFIYQKYNSTYSGPCCPNQQIMPVEPSNNPTTASPDTASWKIYTPPEYIVTHLVLRLEHKLRKLMND